MTIGRLRMILVLVALAAPDGVQRAHAAAITFTPAGVQADADPILDLEVPRGLPLTFTIHVDTTGLPGALVSLRYFVFFDINELSPGPPFLEPTLTVFPGFQPPIPVSPPGSFSVGHTGGAAAPGTTFDILRVHMLTQGQIPSLGLDNNGLADFTILLFEALALDPSGNPINVTTLFGPAGQEVEIQPVPEPASLALVGMAAVLGAGLAHVRRGRRHSRDDTVQLCTPERPPSGLQ